jgi:acyl-CoA thioesterase YciA
METAPDNTRRLALRITTLPRDTNHYGTIFGGVVLSYIDQAGFVEARRHGIHRWVTAALDRVEFKAPIHVGDVINLYTTPTKFGTKSVTILVEVEAERFTTGEAVPVTAATTVMVAIDANGTPIPFRSPPTV